MPRAHGQRADKCVAAAKHEAGRVPRLAAWNRRQPVKVPCRFRCASTISDGRCSTTSLAWGRGRRQPMRGLCEAYARPFAACPGRGSARSTARSDAVVA